jgi:type IV secretion system protein VirB2
MRHDACAKIFYMPRGHLRTALITFLSFWALPTLAQAAGSGLPWEAPLQSILNSVSGPVASAVGTIAVISFGPTLAFGGGGQGLRTAIGILFGLSIAFAATAFFLPFFGFAGGLSIGDTFHVPLHRSLTEPLLLMGVPREFAILNVTCATALFLGLHSWLGLPLGLLIHGLAMLGARKDPYFLEVFRRHLRWQDFYHV